MAPQVFHTDHVVTVSVCRGAPTMPAIPSPADREVLMWRRGADADSVTHPVPEGKDLSTVSRANILAQGLEEVDKSNVAWIELCFVQWFSVGIEEYRGGHQCSTRCSIMSGCRGKACLEDGSCGSFLG